MISYKEAVKLLKENGEFHPYQIFYVFGNPSSKKVLFFEKLNIFLQFTKIANSYKFYSICSIGVPSRSCLKHLRKFKNKQISYFGDLDAVSMWVYLTVVFGDREFRKDSKKKFNVKFTGLKPNDYKEFLVKKDAKIKMKNDEKKILEFIERIGNKTLSDEISFLRKGYKIEMEALRQIGFEKYFKSKIRSLQ